MALKPSCYISEVLRFIYEFDASIFNNPLKLLGYIRDYYVGNKLVADDFVNILNALSNKVENFIINTKDISKIRLEGANNSERSKIQTELFKAIYISKDIKRIRNIESNIAVIYGESVEYYKQVESNTYDSPIISFSGGDDRIVGYGQLINFVWECGNPYRLCLTNGHESMDVTHLDSLVVSAMFDCYELILYNEQGKITDKKIVNLQYKKNVYCINCGAIYFDANVDKYCTKCGVKIFYD